LLTLYERGLIITLTTLVVNCNYYIINVILVPVEIKGSDLMTLTVLMSTLTLQWK